jgi:hypothetical protein
MYSNTWEVAFTKDFVQFGSSECALDKDDDLIEFEIIKEVVQLSILLAFTELHIILLKPVKCKLGLIIDIDLQRVSHEFLADGSNLLRKGGTEHHDLLLGGRGTEDFLNVPTHV